MKRLTEYHNGVAVIKDKRKHKEAMAKLAQYEDLEEQGLLLKLPCKIGTDVYFIPSKVNFQLNVLNKYEENNRVYHQKVKDIVLMEKGWYMTGDKYSEYGVDRIFLDQFYKETWFLDEAEAEKALAEMKEKEK